LSGDQWSPLRFLAIVSVGAAIGRQRTICKIVQISTGNNMFIAFCDTILFQNCRATNGRPYGFLSMFSPGGHGPPGDSFMREIKMQAVLPPPARG